MSDAGPIPIARQAELLRTHLAEMEGRIADSAHGAAE